MASQQTIEDNLVAAVQAINPSIDTVKGPIWDLLLQPVPPEIANVSADVDALETLYSPLIATNPANNQQIQTLGTAFKVVQPTGQRAVVGLVFWFTSLPNTTITIPAGTAVATVDKSIIYTTDSDVNGINSQTAFSYYNASTGRYEVYVQATAAQEGVAYQVPAQRLTLLLSTVTGISGVYNPGPGTGGVDPGDYSNYLSLIQLRMLGRVANSFASYSELALELYPSIITNFVPSSDQLSFRRSVRGDGFDCVVAQPNTVTAEETYSGSQATSFTSTTTTFVLQHQPIQSVNAVYVNGSITNNFVFVQDLAPETTGSAHGTDSVQLLQVLSPSDTVRINLDYDGYCYGLQGQLFNTNTDDFFGADGLVRLATPAQVTINITIQLTTQTSGFQTSVLNWITGYVNGLGFAVELTVQQFLTDLYSTYTEIRGSTLVAFHRVDQYMDTVETLDFLGYETPAIQPANLVVTVIG